MVLRVARFTKSGRCSAAQNPDDWNTAATKCPGINKGRLYTFDEIQNIKKQKRWWNNNQISFICSEVAQTYDWLDSIIKSLNNKCDACGKCCHFDSFGHKLFVTTPELLYFKQNIKNLKPMPAQICSYLENGRCSVRNYRFAACRIFFCKADKDLQNSLSEQTVKKFKALCDKFNFPYRYTELMTALNSERNQ
jgi:Fe-S-cluster containining protein